MPRKPAIPANEPVARPRKATRRNNRSGGITKTGQRYQASITLHAGTLQERRVTHRTRTLADAQAWVTRMLNLEAQGLAPTTSGRITLEEFSASWLEMKARQVRPITIDSYAKTIARQIVPRIGSMRLTSLTVAAVEGLMGAWHADGVSAYQQRRGLTILRMMLSDAVRLQHIPRNAATAVKPPRAVRTPHKRWTGEEVLTFLKVHDAHPLRPYVHVALTTGLRRSELLGLRWADIDPAGGVLVVRQAVTYIGGHGTIGAPKTDSARRMVYLDGGTLAMLEAQRERVRVMREFTGARWHDFDLVFPSRVGTPATESALCAEFRAMCQAAQVPNITLYGLRHTYASLSLERGVPVKLFSERMGHADVAFTMQQYVHSSEAQRVSAALTVSELTGSRTLSQTTNGADLVQPLKRPDEVN